MPASLGEQSGQCADQGAVCLGWSRTADLLTQDVHLVAQHHDLCGLGCLRPHEQRNPSAELTEDKVHESQRHGRRSCRTELDTSHPRSAGVAEYPAPTPVRRSETWLVDPALHDRELVAQRQDLDVFVGAAHRQQPQEGDHAGESEVGKSQQHDRSSWRTRPVGGPQG